MKIVFKKGFQVKKIKILILTFGIFALFAVPPGLGQDQQKPPGFKVEVSQVKLSVLAAKKDKVVHDLNKGNFRVWVSKVDDSDKKGDKLNWQEVEIKNFLNYEERSVAAFFAIDLSASVEKVLKEEIIAADHFLVSLLRPPRNMRDVAATSSFLYRLQIIDALRPEGDPPIIGEKKGQTTVVAGGDKFELVSVIGNGNKLGLIYDKKIKNKPDETVLLPRNSFILNINGKEYRSVMEEVRSDRIILFFSEEVVFSPEDSMTLSFVSPEKKMSTVDAMQKFTVYVVDRFNLHQEWTSDIDKLKNEGLISMSKPGGSTPLFDALYWMGEEFGALEGDYTRIGVVISDGMDTESVKSLDQAVEKLQSSQVMAYAVSVNPPGSGRKILEEVTARTGGQLFVTSNPGDLKKQFDKIVEQIQGVYTLSFDEPKDAGKYHILVEAGEYGKEGKWKKKESYKLNYSKLIDVAKK